MDDKWIDSIRDKMVEYEVVPPEGLLESVEKEVRAVKRRRRLLFSAIAASVALIGCISLMLIPEVEKETLPTVSEVKVREKEKALSQTIAENTIQEVSACQTHKSRSASSTVPEMAESDSEYVETSSEIEIERDVVKSQDEVSASPYSASDDSSPAIPVIVRSEKSSSISASPISVGVSASANGLGSVMQDGNIDWQPNQEAIPSTRMGGGLLTDVPFDNSPTPTFIEMFDHKLPMRFSVDFSWRVAHCLDIGTGLCYSYLRSDIKYGYSDSSLSKATQNLHFIGIPVNLRYTPWSFRKFDVYASLGFMAEKCIAGEIEDESSHAPRYSYEGCGDRPFQFSFNAAAGIQYDITHNCAIFIEPGVGLYLKNGSRLRTIYTERPLTFNINVGLRFGHH